MFTKAENIKESFSASSEAFIQLSAAFLNTEHKQIKIARVYNYEKWTSQTKPIDAAINEITGWEFTTGFKTNQTNSENKKQGTKEQENHIPGLNILHTHTLVYKQHKIMLNSPEPGNQSSSLDWPLGSRGVRNRDTSRTLEISESFVRTNSMRRCSIITKTNGHKSRADS